MLIAALLAGQSVAMGYMDMRAVNTASMGSPFAVLALALLPSAAMAYVQWRTRIMPCMDALTIALASTELLFVMVCLGALVKSQEYKVLLQN